MARRLFWAATGLLGWVYAGYPLAAYAAGRVRPVIVTAVEPPVASVTVGIAIHDEAEEIAARIADVLAQEIDASLEVIVASDGSTDGSDEVVRALAAADPRIRLLSLARAGQTAAQNRILAEARSEIVVLTDAETRFEPGCLAALVEPFADPRVGATTGVLLWRNLGDTQTTRHEGIYWRYEQSVRGAESRAGWLTAATGALLALRRELIGTVPEHSSFDHIAPLQVREARRLILAVPEARATDRVVAGLGDQFRARSRTATRGIAANLAMARRLPPWRSPSAAIAIWSHKILRWASPWAVLLACGAGLLLTLRGQRRYAVAPAGAAAAVLTATWEYRARKASRPGTRIGTAALAIVAVNAAFLRGWLNLLARRRIYVWQGHHWQAQGTPKQP
ncbi:MAG: glycosyltransferase [Chloroflexi bacterium]|nr:glycosyltransferase [Chloroflexota bacterium]